MSNIRLTFNSSTNLTLSIGVYRVLQRDAHYHGYMKNERPNISGFLNALIPELSKYKKNLQKELLEYNNGNEEIAKAVARSIYNVYLYPFAFHKDGVVNVPFRISQKVYNDFMFIHDRQLAFYDTNFTNFIRTLLVEYASKTFTQREYLFAYNAAEKIRKAIDTGTVCDIAKREGREYIVPVAIEVSPIYDHNYVIGFTKDFCPIAIRLREIAKVELLEEKITVTRELCDILAEHLDEIYEKEYSEVQE